MKHAEPSGLQDVFQVLHKLDGERGVDKLIGFAAAGIALRAVCRVRFNAVPPC